MDIVKAVCDCKSLSEEELVVAVKRSSFQFVLDWGVLTTLLVLILTLATGGMWIVAILGWKSDEIIGTKYNCQNCNAFVDKRNLRL